MMSETEIPGPLNATKKPKNKELTDSQKQRFFEEKKAIMLQKWDEFLADNSVEEKIKEHGNEWISDGFIVHIFAPDFKEDSDFMLQDDFYRKVTPYGKVISVSPWNEQPNAKRLQVGDIVHMGDGFSNVQINRDWLEYTQAMTQSGGRIKMEEPPKYIKKYYGMVVEGKLYHPDKSKFMLTNELLILGSKFLNTYKGEFVFELSEFECPKRKVTKNPWL